MKCDIKIKFSELSKSVTAETSIIATDVELSDDNIERLINENQLLFDRAVEFAHLKTLQKVQRL
ncbi:MAG: hypothetical protein B6V02_03265 [Thermoprotei archaeon ex4572_64]|nr:MAG: hypothetical protein B6V02_03265 [Thermoprotei archaeon ex4572_64]